MKKNTPAITPNESRKVLSALNEIERAQNIIYGAAQLLCSVPGFGEEWGRVGKLGDNTKALWHRINDRHTATPLTTGGGT